MCKTCVKGSKPVSDKKSENLLEWKRDGGHVVIFQAWTIDTEQASCKVSREQCFSHSHAVAAKAHEGPLLK